MRCFEQGIDAILVMYSGTDSPYKGGPERTAVLVNQTYPLMKERGIDTRRLRLAAICTVCTKPFLKEVKQMDTLLDGIGFVREEITSSVAMQ
jgi:coenzyme F420-reducing hydrogenase delta subunit